MKLNETYSINNGQGSIVFTEIDKGTVSASYTIKGNKNEGKIDGKLDGNVLKGTFHVDASAGLIEFTFSEDGFSAKWKQGIEPGPMRGKWEGFLNSKTQSDESVNDKASLTSEQLQWIKEKSVWDYEMVPKEWLDSKEFILTAVKNDGRILQYASNNLRVDIDIVLEAVKKDGESLQYVSEELKEYSHVVSVALENNSTHLVSYIKSGAVLEELAENSSIEGVNVNFVIRDLVTAVEKYFTNKISKIDVAKFNEETISVCNDWFDLNQIIYKNHKMDGDALLSLAQVQFNQYSPIPTDGREVEEYAKDLLNQAIDLNDESLVSIIMYGLNPEEYLDFSDLAEKACELLWNREEKNYLNALNVISNENGEMIPGLSNEFVMKIIEETRNLNIGEEEDKENFENFISEAGLE
jgi:hypothetical protein